MEARKACHQEQIEEVIKAGRNIRQSATISLHSQLPALLCNDRRLSTAIWRAQR